MKQYNQNMCIVVCVLILLVGLVGCDQENSVLTTPSMSDQTVSVQQSPEPIANFHVMGTSSDQVGVYVGHEYFMVQVPAGEYLLSYTTGLGTFHLVLQVTKRALLFVGLQPGDEVQKASLFDGTITDIGKETQDHGTVMLFSWPGGPVEWWDVFQFS